MQALVDLADRIARLENRVSNTVLHGTVHSVNPSDGTVRLRLGGPDNEPFLSPHIPYSQIAGSMKLHAPPSVGQQMTMFSPSGDLRQAVAMPMTWSDANPTPAAEGDGNVLTFGGFRIDLKDGELIIHGPKVKFIAGSSIIEAEDGALTLTNGSEIALNAGVIRLNGAVVGGGSGNAGATFNGDFHAANGEFTHNGKNVGSDHKHTGVQGGASVSGEPQ